MSLNFRLVPPKFPSLDRLWLVFGDLDLAKYLKGASTSKEYGRMIKYFYGRLILVVRRLHLPNIQAIFWSTLPPWYIAVETDLQNEMENEFEIAHDWAIQEVQKNLRAYSYAWTQSPASKTYTKAWNDAK